MTRTFEGNWYQGSHRCTQRERERESKHFQREVSMNSKFNLMLKNTVLDNKGTLLNFHLFSRINLPSKRHLDSRL